MYRRMRSSARIRQFSLMILGQCGHWPLHKLSFPSVICVQPKDLRTGDGSKILRFHFILLRMTQKSKSVLSNPFVSPKIRTPLRGVSAILYAYPSTSLRMRPDTHGFSHGLKKCPLDTFLPSLRSGRPFESLCIAKNKDTPAGCPYFWRRRWDSNPRGIAP